MQNRGLPSLPPHKSSNKMSQDEVLKYMKKHKNKWFCAADLNKRLKFTCACANLAKLYKSGEVMRKNYRYPGTRIKCYIYKIK